MQIAAVILFAIAAVAGIILASTHLRGKLPPIAFAVLHGAVAASGLTLLVLSVVGGNGAGAVGTALIFFGVAAIGGFVLFARHLQKKSLPPALILGHGLLAAIGLVLLLLAIAGPR